MRKEMVWRLALCFDKEVPYSVKKILLESKVHESQWIDWIVTQRGQGRKDFCVKVQHKIQSLNLDFANEEIDTCAKLGVNISILGSPSYPAILTEIDDPPLVLFHQGIGDLNYKRSISVVGTRNATSYGQRACAELIEGLEDTGIAVFSGLAYGIDGYAHAEAIKRGLPTWGVLAHGLHKVYPSRHTGLADKMKSNGGVLTEYPFSTSINKWQFPLRNRIIAGISDLTVVVEAGEKGGALITAKWANHYHREVCVFPGNAFQPYSRGCNFLIKSQQAHLIESADDLVKLMNWDLTSRKRQDSDLLFPEIIKFSEVRDRKLYTLLREKMEWTIEEVQSRSQLDISNLYACLWSLEEMGLIVIMAGNNIKLVF